MPRCGSRARAWTRTWKAQIGAAVFGDEAREFATDADRILPGDGDTALSPIVGRLKSIGYTGHVSVELMNPRVYQVPPRSFGEIAMTALRLVLGQAKME